MPQDKQEAWREMIDRCANNPNRLTEWERNFIDSISDQLDNSGHLSEKQAEILDRIYQKVP